MNFLKTGVLGSALAIALGTQASAQGLGIELNKVESNDAGCAAYMVFDNQLSQDLDSLVLDLYTFDEGGIIGENLPVQLAPLAGSKMTIKRLQFQSGCEAISRIMVNSVQACTSGGADVEGCAAGLALSSKAPVDFVQ